MRELNIFNNNILVGHLRSKENSNDFTFIYAVSWIKSGFALTPSLPLTSEVNQVIARNFIENLLPEGSGLDEICNYFNISKSNKFGLIEAIGKETTGSLIFSTNKENNKYDTTFREITQQELSHRIEKRKSIPLSIWDNKPRLSIAGVQEKLLVSIINGKYGLADGDLSSTHILKFDKYDENLVLNEFISLKLAQAVGIKIPNIEIINFNSEQVLKVERFDRNIISDKFIERLHIVDMCQVNGVPVSYKYERPYGSNESTKDIRDGISFKKVFDATSFSKIPVLDKKKIIDWTIVNLCLGNCDAHGKNISFFVDKRGKLELTPFYDIVNIQMYKEKYSQELAMGIYDEFIIENIKAYDFIEFCENNNIKIKTFINRFIELSNKIIINLNNLDLKNYTKSKLMSCDMNNKKNDEFINRYKKDCINRINTLIENIKIINEITI